MTKTDLQKRASELNIDGRSKMSEPELEAAIAQAEGRPALQTEGQDAAAALTAAAGAADEPTDPLTPEQTGRPELIDVAKARAERRAPRVIGATPDTETQEA